jgi:hypothetical protein
VLVEILAELEAEQLAREQAEAAKAAKAAEDGESAKQPSDSPLDAAAKEEEPALPEFHRLPSGKAEKAHAHPQMNPPLQVNSGAAEATIKAQNSLRAGNGLKPVLTGSVSPDVRRSEEAQRSKANLGQIGRVTTKEAAKVPPSAVPPKAVLPHRGSDRRTQRRHNVDTRAVIHFIDVAATESGQILDLSLGGCRIRTDERFPSGIYRRVETEFRVAGLPFRLGGVVQSVHDKHTVGIRFLDLSERKRVHLCELMDEISQAQQAATPDGPDGLSDSQPASRDSSAGGA